MASTASRTVALICASQRGLAEFVRAARRGTWAPLRRAALADRSMLLVGYSGVCQAIEERLRGFETTVVRVATRASEVRAVTDMEAVLDHARRGRLRFALDVTDPEPLPDGHLLFGLPNVLSTPHVGAPQAQ